MNNIKIISVVYAMELDEKIEQKCWWAWERRLSLENKLRELPWIVSADYVSGSNGTPNKIHIKFNTYSIKKVDPKFNNQLWQNIAGIINKHIKEE